ncbi:MAG TPA: cupin domain-containing protein [Candidatus Paceibacterota bacterium]|nr:cupin domain-containing protein [Candidatus Paceibacterota bacterium]
MKGFKDDIEKLTLENEDFRRVLYTSKHSQLVLMALKPLEEVGMEVHADNDQFFRFEQGTGKVVIDGLERPAANGDAFIVPAGSQHNVVNTSETEPMKFYTIYSPAHHKDGVVFRTKEEADKSTEHFDGITTE